MTCGPFDGYGPTNRVQPGCSNHSGAWPTASLRGATCARSNDDPGRKATQRLPHSEHDYRAGYAQPSCSRLASRASTRRNRCASAGVAAARTLPGPRQPGSARSSSAISPSPCARVSLLGICRREGPISHPRSGDCPAQKPCAILRGRPRPGRRVGASFALSTSHSTKGFDHQPRPAHKPDDPDPTGPSRRRRGSPVGRDAHAAGSRNGAGARVRPRRGRPDGAAPGGALS